MQKAGVKTRAIRFFSKKNDKMICVHSAMARDYAKWLEEQPWVSRYETDVPLTSDYLAHVSRVDIRHSYFDTAWLTDCLIQYTDGRKGVREIIDAQRMCKRAEIEKLELSRRYWSGLDISDWKIIIGGE